MRIKSVWLVMAFVCALFACPVSAYASPIDSFSNGLKDFVCPETETVEVYSYEQEFIENYEPALRTVETVEIDEGDTQGLIQNVVGAWQSIPWGANNITPLGYLQYLFFAVYNTRTMIITTAIGMVFMWWGVRKSVRMVFAAFRKGRSNV